MSAKDIEAALARGVSVLDRFLPVRSLLHFPLLYSTCVWGSRRLFDYRERLLSWQAWIDPDYVEAKSDDFVLRFFAAHPDLGRVYRREIESGDIDGLRAAFPALYSLCGLQDPFLKGLFKIELDAGEFRMIAAEFPGRAASACEALFTAGTAAGFWKALRGLGMEIASLGGELPPDPDVQAMILGVLEKKPSGEAPAE